MVSTSRSSERERAPRPISDSLWSAIEPLIPARVRTEGKTFRRKPGAGRKPLPARKAFEAIIHILRTGKPWKSLPRSYGSASAFHRRFDAWHAAGLFHRIWTSGLAEHEEMEGIAWEWHFRKDAADPRLTRSASARTETRHHKHAASADRVVHPPEWQPSRVQRRRRRGKSGSETDR